MPGRGDPRLRPSPHVVGASFGTPFQGRGMGTMRPSCPRPLAWALVGRPLGLRQVADRLEQGSASVGRGRFGPTLDFPGAPTIGPSHRRWKRAWR